MAMQTMEKGGMVVTYDDEEQGDAGGSLQDIGNWISDGWDDFTGVTAAETQEQARAGQAAQEAAAAAAAQQFFADQSAQGMTDIMSGAQMGTQAIHDYGNLALQAHGQSADAAIGGMQAAKAGLASGFQGDPGYQFRQQQGEQAINRAASAHGGRLSGRTLGALADFNSGLASQEYGNYAGREMGHAQNMANLYQGSGDRMAQTFGGMGSQLGSTYTGVGKDMSNIGIGVGTNAMTTAGNIAGAGRYGADAAGMAEAQRSASDRDAAGAALDWLVS